MATDLVKLSGIWVNKDKNGQVYMTGYLGNSRIVILRNSFKTEDKHPGYNMYVQNNVKQESEVDALDETEGLQPV